MPIMLSDTYSAKTNMSTRSACHWSEKESGDKTPNQLWKLKNKVFRALTVAVSHTLLFVLCGVSLWLAP